MLFDVDLVIVRVIAMRKADARRELMRLGNLLERFEISVAGGKGEGLPGAIGSQGFIVSAHARGRDAPPRPTPVHVHVVRRQDFANGDRLIEHRHEDAGEKSKLVLLAHPHQAQMHRLVDGYLLLRRCLDRGRNAAGIRREQESVTSLGAPALQANSGIENGKRQIGNQHADDGEKRKKHQERAGEIHVLAL